MTKELPTNEKSSRRELWSLRIRRFSGWVALTGSVFCGVETVSHFLKANESIDDIRTMSTDHPNLSPEQDILWHQSAIATERIVLAGEETAMRIYGVGSLALFGIYGLGRRQRQRY